MKSRSWVRASIAALVLSLAALSSARAETVTARPIGFEEVPAVVSPGKATFKAFINRAETEIVWELRYSDIEHTVTQTHVHIGKARTNGQIVLFACTNLGNAPAAVPVPAACPEHEGVISGKWTVDNVIERKDQGIEGAERLQDVIAAIREDAAYFNIHTDVSPGGEIRGQIR